MGIHLIPIVAFHLSKGGGVGVATPRFLATLIWPYLLKLCLRLRVSPQDLITSSRFLVFQLSQILVHGDHHHHGPSNEEDDPNSTINSNNNNNNNNSNSNNNSRWHRALRLVHERVAQSRQVSRNDDEESLHLLSMLSL